MSEIRRVVTGNDANGKSVITSDGPCPNVLRPLARPGVAINHLWQTSGTPDDLTGSQDRALGPITLQPPPHGTLLRVVEFPPEQKSSGDTDTAKTQNSYAAMGATTSPATHAGKPVHAGMHKTATVDYAILLTGECYLVLDDSEVLLRAGDTVVQRGNNHAWSNRSNHPCQIAFVLIDAKYSKKN